MLKPAIADPPGLGPGPRPGLVRWCVMCAARGTPRQPLARMIVFTVAEGHRKPWRCRCAHIFRLPYRHSGGRLPGVGFVVAGQDFGDCGVPQCAFRRRCRAIREIGARGDLHAVHGQCPTDRCDPVGVLVLVAERTDQRCRGSHFRAKKLVATLSISMVCSSSLVFTLPLLLADTPATTPLSTSA